MTLETLTALTGELADFKVPVPMYHFHRYRKQSALHQINVFGEAGLWVIEIGDRSESASLKQILGQENEWWK